MIYLCWIQRISFRPYGVFAFYENVQLQSLRRGGSGHSGGVGSSSWAFFIVPRVVWSIPSICLCDEDVFPLQRALQLRMKNQGFCPTFLHASLESITFRFWTNFRFFSRTFFGTEKNLNFFFELEKIFFPKLKKKSGYSFDAKIYVLSIYDVSRTFWAREPYGIHWTKNIL